MTLVMTLGRGGLGLPRWTNRYRYRCGADRLISVVPGKGGPGTGTSWRRDGPSIPGSLDRDLGSRYRASIIIDSFTI